MNTLVFLTKPQVCVSFMTQILGIQPFSNHKLCVVCINTIIFTDSAFKPLLLMSIRNWILAEEDDTSSVVYKDQLSVGRTGIPMTFILASFE